MSVESAAVVAEIAAATAMAGDTKPTVAERRAALAQLAEVYGPDHAPVVSMEDRWIAGGASSIRTRIYWPAGWMEGSAILLQFHGGGWALGDPDVYERQSRALCAMTRSVLIDVDYRRAPEHPYPAALEDCEAVAAWALEYAKGHGLRHDKLNVIGDSAGGWLAAMFCQRNPEMVANQVLVYPVLTVGRGHDLPSRRELGGGEYFLTFDAIANADLEFFEGQPQACLARLSPLYCAPDILAIQPRTLLILAELDPLVDEGVAYSRRLMEAGVEARTLIEPGTIHAFLLFSGAISAGMPYFSEIGRFLREG